MTLGDGLALGNRGPSYAQGPSVCVCAYACVCMSVCVRVAEREREREVEVVVVVVLAVYRSRTSERAIAERAN